MRIFWLGIESDPSEVVIVAENLERARVLASKFNQDPAWLKAEERKNSYELGSKTSEQISKERVLSAEVSQ
ncbi:hypothetical protein M1513_01065 [Patescibacteria group bacterium]|nr:hypothetical protein [Patescibacteria group bacterium]MCL5733364.1 hypothetical protein [Patescibacteria group bacterium]